MIAVLLGPPGSGKGTQAELLAPALGIPHVSTGECLRAEVTAGTAVGREVEPLLAAGHLVPDELIERVLERRLAAPDAALGALLDGYPRTVEQARALDRMLAASGRRVAFVVVLHVAEPVLTERLLRRAGEQHRSDDNLRAIAERLAEYRQMTEPVVDHYRRERAPICDVDGEGDVETVHRRIVRTVTPLAVSSP